MDTFLQLLISGAVIGTIYGLISLGFLVIHHATGIVNFAQGQLLMIGTIITYIALVLFGTNYIIAIPVVVLAAVVMTFVFNIGLVKPLTRKGSASFTVIVGTIAFGAIFAELAALIVGDERYGVPPILPNESINFGSVSVFPQTIIAVAVSWMIVLAVWFFFSKTTSGLSLRAVGINRTGASVSGVRVPRMIYAALFLSIVVTFTAGMLLAPIYGAGPRIGLELGIKGFAAAILGGFDSVYKGMLAGVFLGVLEAMASYYISSSFAPVIAYAVLLIALVVQPIMKREGKVA